MRIFCPRGSIRPGKQAGCGVPRKRLPPLAIPQRPKRWPRSRRYHRCRHQQDKELLEARSYLSAWPCKSSNPARFIIPGEDVRSSRRPPPGFHRRYFTAGRRKAHMKHSKFLKRDLILNRTTVNRICSVAFKPKNVAASTVAILYYLAFARCSHTTSSTILVPISENAQKMLMQNSASSPITVTINSGRAEDHAEFSAAFMKHVHARGWPDLDHVFYPK